MTGIRRLLGAACVLLGFVASAYAQDTPHAGGTLVVGNGDDPRVLAPDFNANVPDVMVGCMIYDGLVRFAPGFAIVPGLAKSWEISPDGLTYTFHLSDSKWLDGQSVTSADVAFTLTQISAKYGPKFAAAGRAIDHVDTPDPLTAVVHLKQSFGPFLFSLVCEQNTGIMPKHIFDGSDILKNPALTDKPVGSGPFRFVEWQRGDHVTVERNPTYRLAPQPYLDRIVLRDIPDSAARVLALQAGEIDFIEEFYFPLNFYRTLSADKRFQIHEVGYGADDLVALNVKHKPFDDAAVRQALLTAIDRDYIHKNVHFGTGAVENSAIDSRLKFAVNPAVNLSTMYPYDPAHARQMLDAAGFKPGADGTRFPLKLAFRSSRAEELQEAQVIARNWRDVGIKVEMAQYEGPVFDQKVFKSYDFDAAVMNYSNGGDPALGVSRLYTSDAINPNAAYLNSSQYANPEVDRLFNEGRDAPTQALRAQAYYKVSEILAKELPVLPLHEQAQIDVAGANVQDAFLAAHYPWYGNIWMK